MFRFRKRIDPFATMHAVIALLLAIAAISHLVVGAPGSAIALGVAGIGFAVIALVIQAVP